MSYDTVNEDRLLERLKAVPSDASAWAELYKRYWPFVFAVAYRRSRGARELAEDIAQDVCHRLFRTKPFDRIPGSAALRFFLYVMTANTAKSQLARFLSRREWPLPDSSEASIEGSVETQQDIERATQALAPIDQKILSHFVSGMRLNEVASATGPSYSNVAVRLRRLRKLLCRLLEETWCQQLSCVLSTICRLV